jgi:hypothetical protein
MYRTWIAGATGALTLVLAVVLMAYSAPTTHAAAHPASMRTPATHSAGQP